jgi:long-subunit acyl-CoA synthetase (AMP-forming)
VDLLFEDIQLAQPSSVAATPVFWNKIYSEFKANVNALVQSGHEVRQEQKLTFHVFHSIYRTI